MNDKLLVFDVDGVLRDSSKALDESYKRAFKRIGMRYNFLCEDVYHIRGIGDYNGGVNLMKALIALTIAKKSIRSILEQENPDAVLDEIVQESIGVKQLKDAETASEIYKEFFNSAEAGSLMTLFPNLESVLRLLKEKGYMLAIFTNSHRVSVERDVPATYLEKFSAIITLDDVKKRKPSGEGIVKAMAKIGTSPKNTYYVGDAVSDIIASRDAGCKSITVLWGMGTKMILEKARPDYIFKDIQEMANCL